MNVTGIAITLSAYKCYYGINQYGLLNYKINSRATSKEYPRCSNTES